ncbi:HTH-type transcriptional regulator DegA [bioreactor metagenome]|uniref:HTH-type transcriptional regulator DegA n=1 Tax=bioreactor metagenome TaxID=1076179 RepID=A0A645CDE4_9ZZZZ
MSVPVDENLCVDTKVSFISAKEVISKLINDHISFDGVFANNDIMAMGAMQALRDNGIEIGKEVKIVGFDNISLTEICSPPMTTISQDVVKLAQRSVDELLKLIQNQSKGGDVIVIPVELVKRQTT